MGGRGGVAYQLSVPFVGAPGAVDYEYVCLTSDDDKSLRDGGTTGDDVIHDEEVVSALAGGAPCRWASSEMLLVASAY